MPKGGKRPNSGRKPKLRDAASRRKLLAHIRDGVSIQFACRLVGISDTTLRNERDRDADFAAQLEKASAERVKTLTEIVYAHAANDPKTALHLLACLDQQYRKPSETQTHLHAHADVPPRVIFEIIDERLGIGTNPAPSPPSTSSILE